MKKHIVYATLLSKNKVCIAVLEKGPNHDSYRQYHISPREAHELARSLLNIISANEGMPDEDAGSATGNVQSDD